MTVLQFTACMLANLQAQVRKTSITRVAFSRHPDVTRGITGSPVHLLSHCTYYPPAYSPAHHEPCTVWLCVCWVLESAMNRYESTLDTFWTNNKQRYILKVNPSQRGPGRIRIYHPDNRPWFSKCLTHELFWFLLLTEHSQKSTQSLSPALVCESSLPAWALMNLLNYCLHCGDRVWP